MKFSKIVPDQYFIVINLTTFQKVLKCLILHKLGIWRLIKLTCFRCWKSSRRALVNCFINPIVDKNFFLYYKRFIFNTVCNWLGQPVLPNPLFSISAPLKSRKVFYPNNISMTFISTQTVTVFLTVYVLRRQFLLS